MAKKTELVALRVPPQRVAVWKAAAAHDDVTLSELLRRAADRYSRERLTSVLPVGAGQA